MTIADPRIDLQIVRSRIETADDGILDLLRFRRALVLHAGRLKRAAGLPLRDPRREEAELQRLEAELHDGELPDYFMDVFRAVFAASLREQEARFPERPCPTPPLPLP